MEQLRSPGSNARRASRRRRVPSRGIRLRQRDVDILLALAKMRLLRTSDLTRLFFDAKGTCQKRLRKLFDAGLVRAIVTDLAAENRYALTRFGHALLVEAASSDSVPEFRRAPRTDGRSVAHLDLLNQYRIALACAAPDFDVRMVHFIPEWDLRGVDPQAPLIPDALMALRTHSGMFAVALEVDTGTEKPAAVAAKIEAYERAALMRTPVFGATAPTILILTPNGRRALSVAKKVAKASLGRRVLLGAAPFVLEDGGLESGLTTSAMLAALGRAPGSEGFRLGMLSLFLRPATRATSAKSAYRQHGDTQRKSAGSSRVAAAGGA